MEFKTSNLMGMTLFSRAFQENCREDFIAHMGTTPEQWEEEMSAKVMDWIRSPESSSPPSTFLLAAPPRPVTPNPFSPTASADAAGRPGSAKGGSPAGNG